MMLFHIVDTHVYKAYANVDLKATGGNAMH